MSDLLQFPECSPRAVREDFHKLSIHGGVEFVSRLQESMPQLLMIGFEEPMLFVSSNSFESILSHYAIVKCKQSVRYSHCGPFGLPSLIPSLTLPQTPRIAF